MTVKEMRDHARRTGCKAPGNFWTASIEELERAFNGAGPDWMTILPRKVCSWLLRTVIVAVLIHDWEFHNSNGDRVFFAVVNIRFWRNCYILINAKYSWYAYPFKVWAKRKADIAYWACKSCGMKAWQDGYKNKIHRLDNYNKKYNKEEYRK